MVSQPVYCAAMFPPFQPPQLVHDDIRWVGQPPSVDVIEHGFKLVLHLEPECLRFSGESTAFGIYETNVPRTQPVMSRNRVEARQAASR
jgi:hypothetical protein